MRPMLETIASFYDVLLGEPYPAPDPRVVRLVHEYHVRCEAFDRSVCSHVAADGVTAMPANEHEGDLIRRNARRVWRMIVDRAARLDIDPALLLQMRRSYIVLLSGEVEDA